MERFVDLHVAPSVNPTSSPQKGAHWTFLSSGATDVGLQFWHMRPPPPNFTRTCGPCWGRGGIPSVMSTAVMDG